MSGCPPSAAISRASPAACRAGRVMTMPAPPSVLFRNFTRARSRRSGENRRRAPVRPAFERDGALTDGGEAVFGVEDRGDAIGEAEPLQACGGEDDRGVVTLVETVEPRVDVAAKRLDPELRIALAQLRFATQAR